MRFIAILGPLAETQPAEVITALPVITTHMDAALILLDRLPALRAFFSVSLQPPIILAVVRLLVEPNLDLLAGSRFVLLVATFDTE